MPKAKKAKIKQLFAAKSSFCKNNVVNTQNVDANQACLCNLDSVNTEYSIVYTKSHLELKKFDCGCRIYLNKYYPEFNYSRYFWNDFFDLRISHEKSPTPIVVNLLNKVNTN